MISFDSPAQFLHHTTFEERFQFLLANVCPTHPFIVFLLFFLCLFLFSFIFTKFDNNKIVATRVKCSHNFHVDISLQRILEDGGEGLILRKMASQYEQGRSRNLIKLKVSRSQSKECRINKFTGIRWRQGGNCYWSGVQRS